MDSLPHLHPGLAQAEGPSTSLRRATLVEPVAGVIGAGLVLLMTPILPYALSFAAGAMIYVVTEELIPESQGGGHVDLATIGVIVGFAVMMMLDVGLG